MIRKILVLTCIGLLMWTGFSDARLHHDPCQINAGNQLHIQSGGDTHLIGAVAQGKQVTADIGGNLTIQSLQDTSRYDSKNQSASGSGTFGFGGASVSATYSQSEIDASYASVNQQSGIQAGDGGFQLKVAGDTELMGAVITSTDEAIAQNKNSLQTENIHTQDITNHSRFSAEAFSVGTGGAGYGSDGEKESSVTQSGISGLAGNTEVRTGDASTGLQNSFDADKVQREIDSQTAITGEFGKQAPKAWGDYASSKRATLTLEAMKESDPERRQALVDEAAKWDEGGSYHLAGHAAIGGLSGGMNGTLATTGSVATMSQLGERIDHLDLPEAVKSGLNASLAAGIGAALGGSEGAMSSYNAELNNRQLHDKEIELLKAMSKDFAQSQGISPEEAEIRLLAAANSQTDQAYSEQHAQGDGGAQDYLRSISQVMDLDGERMLSFAPAGYYEDSSKFADQTGYEAERELLASQPVYTQDEKNQQIRGMVTDTLLEGTVKGIPNAGIDAVVGLPEMGAAILGSDWQAPRIPYSNEMAAQVGQDVGGLATGATGVFGLFKLGNNFNKQVVPKEVNNPVPDTVARVVPDNPITRTSDTLGRPGAGDVFVTAADDIRGLNAKQIAERLTIPESPTGFRIIEFPTPESGIASPVHRSDPGFIGGGRTAGGAREFVIPNGTIPTGSSSRVVP